MTTAHIKPPTRDLLTHELVGWLSAVGIQTQPKYKASKPITPLMIKHARMYGHLPAERRGRDYWYTPQAVMAWIAGGCKYGKQEEAGE